MEFVLFHYPIFEWDGYFKNSIHLYGHVHNCGNNPELQKRFDLLGNRAINVGVDVNGFCPVGLEKITEISNFS